MCLVDNRLRVLTLSVRLNKQQEPFTKITRSSNCRCPDRSGQIPDLDSIANMFKYRMILSEAHKLKLMRKQQRRRKRRRLLIFQMTSVWCWCEIKVLVMPVWNSYSTRSMETWLHHCVSQWWRNKRCCFVSSGEICSQERWCSAIASQLCQGHNEGCATFLIDSLSCLESMHRHWGLAIPVALVLCSFAAQEWVLKQFNAITKQSTFMQFKLKYFATALPEEPP